MNISLRKGTSCILVVKLDGSFGKDVKFSDFNRVIVRLAQGAVVIDKDLIINSDSETIGAVYYSQEETIKLSDKTKAQLQVFFLKESTLNQIAIKSDVYEVLVLESLWDSTVTSGVYDHEYLDVSNFDISEATTHKYCQYLHIDIEKFDGVLRGGEEYSIIGKHLMYDPLSNTLYSEGE